MNDYAAYARLFHETAVSHGWWEGPRPRGEVYALIHSEWSEALEEYRHGKPMRYFGGGDGIFDEPTEQWKKPEGIAVELADGVIRILDYRATLDVPDPVYPEIDVKGLTLPCLIAELHALTTDAYRAGDPSVESGILLAAADAVFAWIRANGTDPVYIIEEKHAYNETRSYRHGGKKA